MLLKITLLLFAYLIGSISSAIIVCKLCKLPDPRTAGSHNPGATNVLRLGGKQKAALVLIADLLKGFIPTVIAVFFKLPPHMIAFIGLASIIGHIFPLYYGFKGGKGVATSLGVYLGINLVLGLAVAATWLIIAKIWHYSSLAALAAIILAPWYALLFFHGSHYLLPLVIITILIVITHYHNIQRLLAGAEPKIGKKPVANEVAL